MCIYSFGSFLSEAHHVVPLNLGCQVDGLLTVHNTAEMPPSCCPHAALQHHSKSVSWAATCRAQELDRIVNLLALTELLLSGAGLELTMLTAPAFNQGSCCHTLRAVAGARHRCRRS